MRTLLIGRRPRLTGISRSEMGFASRQMKKPEEHRIGTLVVSMEMGLIPSSTRLAQSITEVDGMRPRL